MCNSHKGAPGPQPLPGFRHLPGYLSEVRQRGLLVSVRAVLEEAPLYCPTMPRTGSPFSVRMSNCGVLGWVSDRDGGYRYQAMHPLTGQPWPPMPPTLIEIWQALAEFAGLPEACLINLYGPDARMGSHRDQDEEETGAPVISVSLGDDATFHIGGLRRSDPKHRVRLRSGDVVVIGGGARMAYHGVDRVHPGTSALLTEGGRINLTMRRVTRV